jgi:hypothetical protein
MYPQRSHLNEPVPAIVPEVSDSILCLPLSAWIPQGAVNQEELVTITTSISCKP